MGNELYEILKAECVLHKVMMFSCVHHNGLPDLNKDRLCASENGIEFDLFHHNCK